MNWNEGASTYSGATCGINDTASSSNHWANRLTPSYPGDSASNWGDGSSLTDSSWEIVGARGVGTDIYPWSAADTVRCNKTTTLPGSWTQFPVQSSWFQDWYDGLGNSGFAIGQDTLYDSSSCELNYRSRKELPTTNNAPRLTIWWSYQAAPSEGTPVRRRVIQQVYGASARLMQEWGFVYEGHGSWSAVMNTTALQLTIIDLLERYDIDENGRVNIGDIQALLSTLWSGSAVESFAIEEYQEGEIW